MWERENTPVDADGSSATARERFEALYQRRYSAVYTYVLRRLSPDARNDVADVVAEVFAAAWRCRDALPSEQDELLWLYAFAYGVLRNHRRSATRRFLLRRRLGALALPPLGVRRAPAHDDAAHAAESADADDLVELHELVRTAMGKLGPLDQEILRLALWEELDHAEIGRMLGCTPNAVSIRLHKARQRLRAQLLTDAPGLRSRDDGHAAPSSPPPTGRWRPEESTGQGQDGA
ncbi:MAG: sigma-70 family RNA polymerase sigma factor [Actinomycetota bacterium]|nr:sigma-70 family RNA polymerase sigma factor [Actinomycetota bacterium]